jgi:hypothetical protein
MRHKLDKKGETQFVRPPSRHTCSGNDTTPVSQKRRGIKILKKI